MKFKLCVDFPPDFGPVSVSKLALFPSTHWILTKRFLNNTAIVTFPMAGT